MWREGDVRWAARTGVWEGQKGLKGEKVSSRMQKCFIVSKQKVGLNDHKQEATQNIFSAGATPQNKPAETHSSHLFFLRFLASTATPPAGLRPPHGPLTPPPPILSIRIQNQSGGIRFDRPTTPDLLRLKLELKFAAGGLRNATLKKKTCC